MNKVIVVGSGPAGASAAVQLAKSKVDVTVIESVCFPRYCPGETLHPGIEPIFESLGVAEQVNSMGFLRFPGILVRQIGENAKTEFQPFGSDTTGPWMGYQIPREILDQILMNQAVRKGATIIQPCRAIQPIRAGERVIGVATDRGEFFSDWVVDATGRKNWLARHLKLGFEKRSNRKVVSYGCVE